MNKEQFVDWWIQTQSGHSEHQSTFWDRKGQRAGIWADFEQVAHFVTGQPKVMQALRSYFESSELYSPYQSRDSRETRNDCPTKTPRTGNMQNKGPLKHPAPTTEAGESLDQQFLDRS
jgi:hypothetical protein